MATNIDKSLASLPMGLIEAEFEGGDEPLIEIEIADPEGLTIGVDGVEIQLEPESETGGEEFDANLAEFMDESALATVASELIQLFDADVVSRKDWSEMYVKGLEVLGMKYEERTEPWNNACGVYSPLLTEAAIRFQSEMITETFPAQGPVKTLVLGESTPENEDAAERVRDDMNYRLTDEMIEYRPEHERMLYSLGLAGCAFKKVYYDPTLRRQVAMYIAAEDIVMPYGASNVYNAERVTHVMRKTENEVKKLMAVGFYCDIELGEPVRTYTDIEKKKAEEQGYTLTDDDRYQILEIHVDHDLPGYESEDGVAYPYIITIERGTQKVLSIRRNWEEGDERHLRRQHFVQYTYVPGFGAYGLGFIHIIGGYARAGTSLIRQLIDAGTLSNLPGGLKTRGLRIKGDDTPIAPGEFKDVDIPSGALRDNIMPLPYKEPSQVLAALLEKITDDGRRLAAIADLKFSDMSAQAPVGTTLALLERQLKTMSAVQARVHASLKMEFKLLKQIIRDYMPEDYSYTPVGGDRAAKQADYDLVEVIPVSDPNASTMAQRIMQYQAALQLAQGAPQIYDLPQLHRQMLEVLGIKNAEKLVPVEEDQKPRDPISENMSFLTGKPVKAFIHQDHRAHIATHMALLQDPMVMQMIGQSPMAQQMGAAIMAHVSEHMAFEYRNQIEQQLGVPMTPPDAELDPQIEVQLSRLVAQAAQQLLQGNVQKAQAAQAQQQAQDPLVQMQQAELQLKQQELQLKGQDSQRDYEIAQQKLQLEAQRLMLEARNKQGEDPRLKAAMAQQDMQHKEQVHRQKMQHTQQSAAIKVRTQAMQAAQKATQTQSKPAGAKKG